MKALRISLIVACCAALAIVVQPAVAAEQYYYSAQTYGQNNLGGANPTGSFYLQSKGTAKTLNVRVRHGADPAYFTYDSSPATTASYYSPMITGLLPGDLIEVRQPANSVLPTEVIELPALSLTVAAGSRTVTGSAPAGKLIEVGSTGNCWDEGGATRMDNPTGSVSYTAATPLSPGVAGVLTSYSGQGDVSIHHEYVPGETPCFSLEGPGGGYSSNNYPGSPSPAKPYRLSVYGLSLAVAPTARLLHIRGSSTLSDITSIDPWVEANSAEPVLPGDRFELYRPNGAAAPSVSVTVPQVSAVFDPSVDLVAVDHPGAVEVSSYPCRQFSCPFESVRSARNRAAGRTVLDFSKTQAGEDAVDLRPTDRVRAWVKTASPYISYAVLATPGDLAAPAQKLSIASKLKLSSLIKAFKKGLKVKLTSNEAGTANVTLTLGKAKLATAKNVSAKAGTTTVKLKFTKSGRKALTKLKKRGQKFKSQKATLTSVITDAAGNAQTTVKRTTLKR